MVPQIHDLTTLSIWSQVGTPMNVVFSSTWSERERVTPDGEQDVVVPSGVVRGGEVKRDRGERTDVLNASDLDVDVGDDGSLVVIVRRSHATGQDDAS
jgi:hypothetical protein